MTIKMATGKINENVVTYQEGTLTVTLTANDIADVKKPLWGESLLRVYSIDGNAFCSIEFSEPVQSVVLTAVLPGNSFVSFTDKDGRPTPTQDIPVAESGFVRIERKAGSDGIKSLKVGLGSARATMVFFNELAVEF